MSVERYDIDKVLRVFIPRTTSFLSENEIEILDSPGVDCSKTNDTFINKYCEDADVFVLVIDGCSTLNGSEKIVFMNVKNIIATPNIFVLINEWDLVSTVGDFVMTKTKQQHLNDVSMFLINDLGLYTAQEIKNRIFLYLRYVNYKINVNLN